MELHFCERLGLSAHAKRFQQNERKTFLRLDGMVKYIAFIERRKSEAIKKQWERIRKAYHGPTMYSRIGNREHEKHSILADETEFGVDDAQYLAVCFVRAANRENIEQILDVLRGDYFTRPGAKGDLDALQTVGIHYTDAHFDLRTLTLSCMTDLLEWSASIHFARLDGHASYKANYLRIFADLVRQEFLTCDDADVEFLVEKNDKVKLPSIIASIEEEYRRTESEGARRPKSLPVVRNVGRADTSALTLPDFVLAAFRNYAMLVPDERILDFERIRDRVRYIGDSDRGIYYTRKMPFMGIRGEQ
jgi:hypothetical protein